MITPVRKYVFVIFHKHRIPSVKELKSEMRNVGTGIFDVPINVVAIIGKLIN